MKELGQIDNPAYLLFKSMIDLTKDVENAKLFKMVADNFAENIQTVNAITGKAVLKQLPKTQRLGLLAGKFVPENIYGYIQEIAEPVKYTLGKKLIADFKFMKVILNPATNVRNVVSNKILNWWRIGMNPADPKVWKSELESIKEIAKPGKWINEVKPLGYDRNTMAFNEILSLFDDPQAIGFGKKLGNTWGNIKSKIGKIYQGEENQSKLAAYIFNRKYKNLAPEEAWKLAESATFNYAQVTPFVRKLRTALFGFPFITFTLKATPVAVETMLKYPRRVSVFGKIKNAIENMADIKETDEERASEPPWIRDGFYIKLPIKDKYGRSAYFDLTYIIPFGDLVSGQFIERQVITKKGTKESIPEAMMAKAPAMNFLKEISRNQDFYGNKIWKESDSTEKQLGDLFRHLSKTYLPPLIADQIPGGYNDKGERQWRGFVGTAKKPAQELNQNRTLMEEMLRQVGVKIQPVDADIQSTYQEWNKRKALEKLLIENGILSEFNRTYIPKK